jgi:hypothetical protein
VKNKSLSDILSSILASTNRVSNLSDRIVEKNLTRHARSKLYYDLKTIRVNGDYTRFFLSDSRIVTWIAISVGFLRYSRAVSPDFNLLDSVFKTGNSILGWRF